MAVRTELRLRLPAQLPSVAVAERAIDGLADAVGLPLGVRRSAREAVGSAVASAVRFLADDSMAVELLASPTPAALLVAVHAGGGPDTPRLAPHGSALPRLAELADRVGVRRSPDGASIIEMEFSLPRAAATRGTPAGVGA
jgi:hypothetical protein